MAKIPFKLKWRGKKIGGIVDQAAISALSIFGLKLEAAAKRELQPGHGVITGTARRSIHASDLEYTFQDDDVEPGAQTKELGFKPTKNKIKKRGGVLSMVFGSGLRYAMPLHQGHGSFQGYHFLIKPYDQLKDGFPAIYAAESRHLLARDKGK